MTLRELDDLVDEMLREGRPTMNQIELLDSVNWELSRTLAVLKRHPAPLSLARRLARLGDFLFEHGLEGSEVAWEACEGIIMWLGEHRPELAEEAYELGEQLKYLERGVNEGSHMAKPPPGIRDSSQAAPG